LPRQDIVHPVWPSPDHSQQLFLGENITLFAFSLLIVNAESRSNAKVAEAGSSLSCRFADLASLCASALNGATVASPIGVGSYCDGQTNVLERLAFFVPIQETMP
jgi:hypothetical protein